MGAREATLYNAYSCIGNKYADQTGVADYVGVYDYPFKTSGYTKAQGLARLAKETGFVINSMHAVPVWLDQAHGGSCAASCFRPRRRSSTGTAPCEAPSPPAA